jgi:hypothetical protein
MLALKAGVAVCSRFGVLAMPWSSIEATFGRSEHGDSIDYALLDYAYTGHGGAVAASRRYRQTDCVACGVS